MKKFLALIFSLQLALMSSSVFAFSSANFKNGDVDRSGVLKIQDANRIQRFLARMVDLDDEEKLLADYNFDGKITINDVSEIQMVLAHIKDAPVEPSAPTQASDPSTPTEPPTEAPTEPATASNPKVNSMVKVSFTNNLNWANVYFFVYNSVTGDGPAEWPGTKITTYTQNEFGEKIFYSTIDTDKYDRIIFNSGGSSQTVNVSLNKASSGYYISNNSNKKAMKVGTYASTGADGGTLVTTTLRYPSGYNKKIWIWTPADYSPTGDSFRTLYLLDGQNLFDSDHSDNYGGWEVTDAVESMMANGGRGTVIVGIDNGNNLRDSELTPDLGEVIPSYSREFSNRTGEQFASFVTDTVMPYIRANYNVSTAACDNLIAGSSSGGLEAFYIGMENRDKFGMIGALSPAFLLFEDTVWSSYMSKFDFSTQPNPMLYIYNGNDGLETELYPDVISMHTRLLGMGYDTSKIKLSIEDKADHNEAFWRVIFPECISWCLGI